MDASTLLLIASLGSIAVLLMLYAYFFMFERRCFLVLWITGWSIIALNYFLDAFYPYFLRQKLYWKLIIKRESSLIPLWCSSLFR